MSTSSPPRSSAEESALALRARELGCRPVWRDGIVGWAWHCPCPGGEHAHDQQLSAINPTSLDRCEAARARQ
jgi:hypothetical protein